MTDNCNVLATGQLTPGDLYRYYLSALLKRFWWFLVLMAVVGTWFIVSLSTGTIHWEWKVSNLAGPLFVFAFMPYAFFIAPYFTAKKQVRTNPNLNGPVRYQFSESGIELSGPNVQANLNWKAIVNARETASQILLYPQQTVAHVIPKRFLAGPDDLSALRSLIRVHVPKARLLG